jgi:secreted Zn-dependent insulinase-like peptidase
MCTDIEEKQAVLLSHPDQYIGALLGHEGPGSLLSYYKSKVNTIYVDLVSYCVCRIVSKLHDTDRYCIVS